ncbi:MAG: hypothetical protein E7388_00815 [Ruminococcaceae bacterium]|nr:hypothetical protein [Oscillospiraceae bacterium]
MELYGAYLYYEKYLCRCYLYNFGDYFEFEIKRYLYNGRNNIFRKRFSGVYVDLFLNNRKLRLKPVIKLKKYYNEE